MIEVSTLRWRMFSNSKLLRWAGSRLLAAGKALAKCGHVRDARRTSRGGVSGVVFDSATHHEFCVGVAVVEVFRRTKRKLRIESECTCGRVPCAHAVAVAVVVRVALAAGMDVPSVPGADRRAAEFTQPEIGGDSWEEPVDEGWW